jgi:hypothetical protein
MKKPTTLVCLVSLFVLQLGIAQAQDKPSKKCSFSPDALKISVFNNQTYMPFLGISNVWQSKMHPGVAVSFEKNLKQKQHVGYYYSLNAGVFNHRFIQTGVQLYANIGVRFNLPKSFKLDAEFGGGYLHSILHQKTFKKQDDGSYEQTKSMGRPQAMFALAFALSKDFNIKEKKYTAFIKYQPWFQLPYINNYVPLLPNNALHLGVGFPLTKKN